MTTRHKFLPPPSETPYIYYNSAEVGADVVTCPLSAIKGLLNHPLTDIGLEKFLADYKKVNG